jgi:hypothetical protein
MSKPLCIDAVNRLECRPRSPALRQNLLLHSSNVVCMGVEKKAKEKRIGKRQAEETALGKNGSGKNGR